MDAWVIDAPEIKDINPLLDWTRKTGLDRELRHLKRIRRLQTSSETQITILLCASNTPIPPLPPNYSELAPYTLAVPARAALNMPHLALKNAVWPTVYAPLRPDPDEVRALEWDEARRTWVLECVRELVDGARRARVSGELPIAAFLPQMPGDTNADAVKALTHDTRTSESHPLRHAVINLVRLVGSLQSQSTASAEYFLTGRSLFLTHEPCIMCSMALVHSRVKEVYILIPMRRTGGAGGGEVNIVALPNVNHRYRIWRWHPRERVERELELGILALPDNVDS
ncbi:cytidine deaminase-like protein [Exidia glandulosa HHB12029]|uniref:Cytidine deaminase-like protein n=1 Tax=Exidia glandulosa HHB12029 TaxID=1314781 RepID=A0A165K4Z7_EXIGL|nr:cytidine deaminase-like protein [Exidia glandulosa HHB12029]